MKKFFLVLLLLAPLPAWAACAVTQPTPAFTSGGNVFGRLAPQWNAYFGSKISANGGAACDLTLSGTIDVSGATIIGYAQGQFRSVFVNQNIVPLPTPLTGTLLQLGPLDATASRIELAAFGATAFNTCRVSGGTNSLPTALASGAQLCSFDVWGYDGTAWAGPAGSVSVYAGGTWSNTSHPTRWTIATTPAASTTLTDRWHVDPNGGLYAQTATGASQGTGTVNSTGFYVNGVQLTAVLSAASPLTIASNTVQFSSQAANQVLAGPTSGGAVTPAFRTLVAGDIPILASAKILGTTTNDDAASGYLGEYIFSNVAQGSSVPFTANVIGNVTSISLTAGDWQVCGNVTGIVTSIGTAGVTRLVGGISTASAAFTGTGNVWPVSGAAFEALTAYNTTAGTETYPTGCRRVSVAVTTTVYLVGIINWTNVAATPTMGLYGFIGARRVR